jgi:hypothetical protein
MKIVLLLFLLVPKLVFAQLREEFPQPQPSDILTKLIASAAESEPPFKSRVYKDKDLGNGALVSTFSYYFAGCHYAGSCNAPFGKVYAAEFTYQRKVLPPTGFGNVQGGGASYFLAFFDADYKLREYWELSRPTYGGFEFWGTRLARPKDPIFDFANPPASRQVTVDGKVHKIPEWK